MKTQNFVTFSGPMSYTKGYKYQLYDSLSVFIPALVTYGSVTSRYVTLGDGLLVISRHWAWDGASGPTIDTKSSMRASCVHDAIYYLIRQGLLPPEAKEIADELLHDICLIDEMWHWRADIWYAGVDKLADAAADPKNKRTVYLIGGLVSA